MYREPRRFETYPFESESAYAATRLKTCQVRVPGPLRLGCGTLRAAWNGEIVLMARRAGLADLSRRFDIIIHGFSAPFTNIGGSSAKCAGRLVPRKPIKPHDNDGDGVPWLQRLEHPRELLAKPGASLVWWRLWPKQRAS